MIARVEADVEGEEVKLRLQGVEMLDKAAAQMVTGLEIFVRDAKPIEFDCRAAEQRRPRAGAAGDDDG